MSTKTILVAVLVVCVVLMMTETGSARYLPTRSNGDRLDKLRELLRELLESEIEQNEYQRDSLNRDDGRKVFFKREVSAH